jgi:hypothetical protein
MNVSVIGCSFVGLLNKLRLLRLYPGAKFHVDASAGSGNRAIAATVLNHLAQVKPDAIVILWSGINRIDVPMPANWHNAYGAKPSEASFRKIQDQYWYHSGGFGCGGLYPPTPKILIDYFKSQHLGETPEYFTDLSLLDIIGTLATLKIQNIPYYSNFIYDVHADYSNYADIMFNSPLEHTLGKISPKSQYYNLMPWDHLDMQNTPFEWAKNQNLLDTDQFHPTPDAMHAWFDQFVITKLGIQPAGNI